MLNVSSSVLLDKLSPLKQRSKIFFLVSKDILKILFSTKTFFSHPLGVSDFYLFFFFFFRNQSHIKLLLLAHVYQKNKERKKKEEEVRVKATPEAQC